ncbi:MAG TPA: CHAT domain-containing tetratricopeptide repeat protein [Thermoanaerobaculia bacterium]|jgi:CHAT domain-containing protein/predicted negative regulator of RcsB-dependent stress response
MFIRRRWLATGAVSACLLQGLSHPLSAATALPTSKRAGPTTSVRKLFDPPTQRLVSHQLQGGGVHVYPLPLKAGERVEVIADQDGVDLAAALFDPGGQHLFTVDNPTGTKGPERVLWVAEVSGQYRIEISCGPKSAPGTYRIWIKDEGPATARDRADALAERLFYQAVAMQRQRSAEPALEAFQNAVLLWKQDGNQDRQADALDRLGGLFYDNQDWKKSLDSFDQARNLYRKLRRAADEGRMNNSIGTIRERLSDLTAAQENYRHALDCGERSQDPSVIAASLQNLGSALRKQGRAEEALRSLGRAQAEWKGLNAFQEARTLTSMGEVFLEAGQWAKAREKYQQALAVLGPDKDPGTRVWVLLGFGDLYLKTGELDQARRYYEAALKIQQQQGLSSDLAVSLDGLATMFLNAKRPQDALEPYRKALKILEKNKDTRGQAKLLLNLGWTYMRLNREKDARTSFERAMTLTQKRDLSVAAGAMLGLARLEESRGNPIAARRRAEAAVRYVEELRAVKGNNFRISFLATEQKVYDALIEIIFEEHSVDPAAKYDAQALRVSEQERSRGLLDRVSALRSTPGPSLSLAAVPILSLQEIQASVLDPDTLLLEYHLGDKASHLWVVGSSSYQVFKLPPREKIEQLITKFYRLAVSNKGRQGIWEASRAAKNLSLSLLGPATPWLGRKRLLLSTPEALQSVPIGALPDPTLPDPSPGANTWPQPLIVEHEVVRVPSGSVLAALRDRAVHRTRPTERLAFLGDTVTSERDERLSELLSSSAKGGAGKPSGPLFDEFPRLRFTRNEGNAILKEAGFRGVLGAFGFEATRKLVVSGHLKAYQTLHFAVHGHLRSDDSLGSSLVLSRWDHDGQPIDGFLKAADIYDLDLPADLVVLSACDTGLGESIPGEGLVGLPQAFLGAGATRVMVSLWPVEDMATSKLMESFYHEYYSNHLSPSQALRKAQIAMWKAPIRNAPFYWGGFEIEGDWQWGRDPR